MYFYASLSKLDILKDDGIELKPVYVFNSL